MSWLQRVRALLPQQIVGPVAMLYEKVATSGLSGFYRQVASEITSALPRGRVLDVGTGPGHLLAEIARLNPDLELVGLDLSRRMLKIAREVVERHAGASPRVATASQTRAIPATRGSSPSIQLIRADVQDLPFPDADFDLVVSTLSLHHWHDPPRGIRECLRVTAPGGKCWIYDLRTDVPAKAHAALVTGRGIGCWARSWIFKFHGVGLKDYPPQSVERWLQGAAKVRTEAHAAYLKLNMEKTARERQPGAARSGPDGDLTRNDSSAPSASPAALPA